MTYSITAKVENWAGVLGPQSEDEPMHYDIQNDIDTVKLIGPAPGMFYKYEREEFERLVSEGEWLLAEMDYENEVVRTPEGNIPW